MYSTILCQDQVLGDESRLRQVNMTTQKTLLNFVCELSVVLSHKQEKPVVARYQIDHCSPETKLTNMYKT